MAAFQGAYYEQTLAIEDEDGAAINLTGMTFTAQVRTSVTSDTVLVTLSTGAGLAIVDASAGTLKISFTAAQTALLPVGRVVFDVEQNNASPGPVWWFRCTLKVKESVTR